MEPTLVFIGGAPGIGKSTVARELIERLDNSAWLDGDDVWRMRPFRADEIARIIGASETPGDQHL